MNPLVSIDCITYNHAAYIRDALDGFIIQSTSFPFEVCIHDDASTDGTQDIIREYERNYPEVFKVIYQKENQYSKTGTFSEITKIQNSRLRGKYVAACEGDDYWFNPNKLQMQVEYMEAHENCSCAFHSVIWFKDNRIFEVNQPWFAEMDLGPEILIPFGATIVGTCSVLYRKDAVKDRPRFVEIADVGDYPGALNLATKGYFHFFPQVMAAYRWGSEGSWTDKCNNDNEFAVKHSLNTLKWLYEYNLYTDGKYVIYVGKKMRDYIRGIERAGGIAKNPWLGVLLINAAQKEKSLEEFEYYTWFVKTIGEDIK